MSVLLLFQGATAPTGAGGGSVDGTGSLTGQGEAPALPALGGGGTIDGAGALVGGGYALATGGGDVSGEGSLVGAGAVATSTRPDGGGGARSLDISDPRHPYWRIREELDEQQVAEPALEERAQQRPPAGDQAAPATAKPAPHAPGAEVVKALLGVPVRIASQPPEPSPAPLAAATATTQESLQVPPKRRTPDVDEDVLLLLLID